MKVVELHCFKQKNNWYIEQKTLEAKIVFIRKNGKMFLDTKDVEGYVLPNFLYNGIDFEPSYTIIILNSEEIEVYKNKFFNYCKEDKNDLRNIG